MAETTAKLRLKLGRLELDYEGDGAFLGSGLVETIEKLQQLQIKHPLVEEPSSSNENNGNSPTKGNSKGQGTLSTQTIATLLKANSCSDLAIAASAHLSFSQSKETFTRSEIQEQMRAAPTYYKSSFRGGNLTSALETLTKADRLRLNTKDTYSLSAKERTSLGKILAEAN
jgi:hypothetical protein